MHNILFLLSILLLLIIQLASACYHPIYYRFNDTWVHLDNVDSNVTNNPIISSWDTEGNFNYSVSLNSIWEATSTDNGTTLDYVPHSELSKFGLWCIEPKPTDKYPFQTGAVYESEDPFTNRFKTFNLSVSFFANVSRRRPLNTPSKRLSSSSLVLGNQSIPLVRLDITLDNYTWVTKTSVAYLVMAFNLVNNKINNGTNNSSNVTMTGPGTIDLGGAYFSVNNLFDLSSGPLPLGNVSLRLNHTGYGEFVALLLFSRFNESLQVGLAPELGIGKGPGPFFSTKSVDSHSNEGLPSPLRLLGDTLTSTLSQLSSLLEFVWKLF